MQRLCLRAQATRPSPPCSDAARVVAGDRAAAGDGTEMGGLDSVAAVKHARCAHLAWHLRGSTPFQCRRGWVVARASARRVAGSGTSSHLTVVCRSSNFFGGEANGSTIDNLYLSFSSVLTLVFRMGAGEECMCRSC
ncbi:hypothetical protein M438DRAFT_187007 [Aureobasidium pullulans EXF-150]|uniref:Uncharacterized protein n=1 Tax=Aureobasidium pullulans EXF-150 TaxID=1043002 RepID=A0A074XVE1_AURPU|nr:uncharacterized protein M438DRAFT_187007 [Aureobasidium pullulans EXF-150]KEQ85917.1 hypothetical protein M438DRAFT_187007 [Aureobasidium pullulans EXF-150]